MHRESVFGINIAIPTFGPLLLAFAKRNDFGNYTQT